jgi:nucleolar protein 15
MAKSRVQSGKKQAKAVQSNSEKSVDEIEHDLQLPSSSEEELSSEEEDDESQDENDEQEQLSEDSDLSEEEDDNENEKESSKPVKTSGHTVNKVIIGKPSGSTTKQSKKSAIIYIGRIPHGFHEEEMKKYFTQFGTIINLRLCRNKHGKSKHYGFIEFDHYEVAKIAQETMNNYLIFNHLLKVELVDSVHKDLFSNTQTKFKVVPWKKIAKHNHDKPKTEKVLKELTQKFEKSKTSKAAQLKAKGINFDISDL